MACERGDYMSDSISRQVAILHFVKASKNYECGMLDLKEITHELWQIPSAQPEPLTDKEQRIFLAAMGREEEVCKQVDAKYGDCREPYEDSLVSICHEIIRKVKSALWT